MLYPYQSDGGTPLKAGLKTIGNYFQGQYRNPGHQDRPQTLWHGGRRRSCQQSFTIILTDGYYDDLDTTLDGNTDGDNGAPYADSHSNTLADIAMYYYENDLNACLPTRCRRSKYDWATHQHMATYAVAFGVSGTLNPADYDADLYHKRPANSSSGPFLIRRAQTRGGRRPVARHRERPRASSSMPATRWS